MRRLLTLAALALTQTAHGAMLYVGDPPPDPENYLQINLTWAEGEPPISMAWAFLPIYHPIVLTGELPFWYPLSGPDGDCPGPSHQCSIDGPLGTVGPRGEVQMAWGPLPRVNDRRFVLLFEPEIVAALTSVAVDVGPRTGAPFSYLREISVSATGGYSRVYSVSDVPEPGANALACLAFAGFMLWASGEAGRRGLDGCP